MVPKNSKKVFKISYFFGGIIFGLLFFFIITFNNFNHKYKNKIYPNVYIDNINFSGKSKNEILDYFNKKSSSLKKINFYFIIDNQKIASFSGEQLKLKYDGETSWLRAYYVGRSQFYLSAIYQKILSFFSLKKFYFESTINFDNDLIKNYLYVFKQQYDKPAKNALFEFKDNKVVNFRKEEYGREINIDSVISDFKKNLISLKNKNEDKTIIIHPLILKPEITLSSINNFGIEELISIGKSDFTHSIASRIYNLKLASSKFHGILIPPGKILSFNETVGEISSLTGYQPAYIIKEGKTVLGDGGGVCQVSTTLFRAALNAGLEIIERNAHAYRVSYYENDMEPGFDATVFAPNVDLKIKNNTPAYILIQTLIDEKNNLLYFYFYGKKDNRRVEISKPIVWDIIPPPQPKYQEDPILKKGIIKQVDFPAWGAKAVFKYKVYKENKLIIDKDFYSYYRPWQAIYLVGTAD
ncbi:MAG: VanW family protein [Patescibacteria group bacterium]|nr:VanW family protein [Patescibacteria group bacterium]